MTQPGDSRPPLQTEGRRKNAAQPLDQAADNAGAERYPSTGKDDSIEPRSFRPPRPAAEPPDEPAAGPHDFMGPAGDPAEGKR